MKESKDIYINEIIRVTYKCNWKCKFCNVIKVNNYGLNDISHKEVIYKILSLTKKYNTIQLKNLNLSFSGGEPTLDPKIFFYIKLAKKIGVGIIELQTNGSILFKTPELINKLINAGLDNIFLAQHSGNSDINKKLGIFYELDDFHNWIKYIKNNYLNKKIHITLNTVITKINLYYIGDYLKILLTIGFFDITPKVKKNIHIISFGLVQPNGFANINKDEILLEYNDEEIQEIKKIVKLCNDNNIFPDFHFTAPPLCILNFPEYNLEYNRLKKLEEDIKKKIINKGNLESYKDLWKEKKKFNECKNCNYNNYCLGFYKNWIEFVGEEFINDKINKFIKNYE